MTNIASGSYIHLEDSTFNDRNVIWIGESSINTRAVLLHGKAFNVKTENNKLKPKQFWISSNLLESMADNTLVNVKLLPLDPTSYQTATTLYVSIINDSDCKTVIIKQLEALVRRPFTNSTINVGLKYHIQVDSSDLYFVVNSIDTPTSNTVTYAHVTHGTNVVIQDINDQEVIVNDKININKFFNAKALGIGGFDDSFLDIFKRAFVSRVCSAKMMAKYGIRHVKGILLHGPTGTGKTLIARKLSALLTDIEPTIVNGPELLNKYVGQSESNVRNIFSAAKSRPEKLHVYIFDEIDSICRSRTNGTDGSSTMDNMVNQLLTIIDGVNSCNNILIIGTTNRKDLIDPAVLRAGRIELHIHVPLPDFKSRIEIFKIHTLKMTKNSLLKKLDYDYLASQTKNCSGADIETIVKDAVSIAMFDSITTGSSSKSDTYVTMQHFIDVLKAKEISNSIVETYGNLTFPVYMVDNPFLVEIRIAQNNDILKLHDDLTNYAFVRSKLYEFSKVTPIDFIELTDYEKCKLLRTLLTNTSRNCQQLLIIYNLDEILNNKFVYKNFIQLLKYIQNVPIVYTCKRSIKFPVKKYRYIHNMSN